MQDTDIINQLEIDLKFHQQEPQSFNIASSINQNPISHVEHEFQKQISQNNGDLPNLLDLNFDLLNKINIQNKIQSNIECQTAEKDLFDVQSCMETMGRQQSHPQTINLKKNVSIQNPFCFQSSEDLRSLTQSRFSCRKTEATSGKYSMGRECMSSSFFSEGEESNFSRKNSDVLPQNNPSVISAISENIGQKNSFRLGAQNPQSINRSQNQVKKSRYSLVCIEDLIFQQSLTQEEESQKGKVIRLSIPSQNNNFQDEENHSDIQEPATQIQSQQQNQISQIKTLPVEQKPTLNEVKSKSNEIKPTQIEMQSILNEDINQQTSQMDVKNNNNSDDQKIVGSAAMLQNQNIQDLLDEASFINMTYNNNNSSVEQKDQQDTSPEGKSGNITDKESPEKSTDSQNQQKPPQNVLHHLNEDGTSSDDPEIIKPTGFTIRVDYQNHADQNISISKKKHLNYKQITFMEAWSKVKTIDLTKEKKVMMIIRDKMHQSSGLFSKVFTFCTNNSSKNLCNPSLIAEKDQILAFSKVPFDTSDSFHVNMNYTIYCSLRDTQYCPLYGTHWLTIGFRHVNPKQNYEIVGVFGTLQILAFIFWYRDYLLDIIAEIDALEKINEDGRHQTQNNLNNHFQHSQTHNNSQNSSSSSEKNPVNQPYQNPVRFRNKEINLCVVMQEISKNVLIWLEKGLLNTMINIEKSVISVVNKMFFATFYIFYEKFKKEKSGFLSISIAFKTTIDFVESNPSQAFELFKKKISLYYKLRE